MTDAISFDFTDVGIGAVSSAASLTTVSSISASAGGLVNTTTISAGNVIGSSVFFDVQYQFGNAAPDDEYFIQLAGNQSFDAACFRLKSVEIISSDVDAIPAGSVDLFYFQASRRQGGSGHILDVRYELVYMCSGASTTALPYSAQTSGSTNLKYTGNFDSQQPVTFLPGVNPLTVEKTSAALILPPEGGTTTFSVTFTNSSTSDVLLSRIEDTLPEGMVFGFIDFTSQVTESNSSAVPAAGSTGTVVWESQPDITWVVPANNGTLTLRYNVVLDAGDKVYSNSVVGVVGNETVGPATASVIVGTPTGTTGTITSTGNVTSGDPITVTVNDADLNIDPLLADTLTVQAVNNRTGEIETVILTETGANTGLFTGTLPTIGQATADVSDNGVMATEGTDTVTFTYQDVLDSNGGTAAPTATTTIDAPAPLTGVTGTISQDAAIEPDGSVTISVADADLNTDPGVAETVQITTVNETTGETESVTLTETGVSTGVFTATLTTANGTGPGTDNDGTMVAAAGERLTSTYQDAFTDTGDTAAPTASTDVIAPGSVTGTITASASVGSGGLVNITVTDADLNANAGAAETITVTVQNSRTGELETIALTETGSATGVFTGTLSTFDDVAADADDNGTMNTQDGDTLVSTYLDAADAGGSPATVTANSAVTAPSSGMTLQGRVFIDNGAGGGTAHDGLLNGAELVQGGRTVELRDAGGALIGTTNTAPDGQYTFDVDNTYAGTSLTLAMVEISQNERHISSNAGGFADADKFDGRVTFSPTADTNYSDLDFGIAEEPQFSADRQVAVQTSGRIEIAHRYIAPSDLDIAFLLDNIVESSPDIATISLWQDLGCDQSVDPSDTAISGTIAGSAGDEICIIASVQTTSSAPSGSAISFDLLANATFVGTSETSALMNTDLVTIDAENAIELRKSVCNSSLTPCDLATGAGFSTDNIGEAGDVLVYRIGLVNSGRTPISSISIGDTTPAYTSLTGTQPGVVSSPDGFACNFTTASTSAGYQGPLSWLCNGSLLPQENGAVFFEVRIQN